MLILGSRIGLRPLSIDDASDEYLSWLNDPEVNRYIRRAGRTETMAGLVDWLAQDTPDLRLAVMLGDRHIGGISLGSITDVSAELSIMIGARDVWGRGFGREAIDLLTQYGHDVLGLERIWAESPNPAFNRTVRHLGWQYEGTKSGIIGEQSVVLECWAAVARPNL